VITTAKYSYPSGVAFSIRNAVCESEYFIFVLGVGMAAFIYRCWYLAISQ